MIFGLGFLGLTIFCGFRTCRLQKELFPNAGVFSVDQEEESLIPLDDTALDGRNTARPADRKDSEYSDKSDGSSDKFASQKPKVEQDERVFNLSGQGKPIVGMDNMYDVNHTPNIPGSQNSDPFVRPASGSQDGEITRP